MTNRRIIGGDPDAIELFASRFRIYALADCKTGEIGAIFEIVTENLGTFYVPMSSKIAVQIGSQLVQFTKFNECGE